jgi:hypothetical protein
MVTCSDPGFYTFAVNGTIAIDSSQAIADPNLFNNHGSGSATTSVN